VPGGSHFATLPVAKLLSCDKWWQRGLVIGFIELLNNSLITYNYDNHAKLHAPNITITTEHKVFSVFISHCLVAASNSGRSPSSGFPNCPHPQLPASQFSQLQLSTDSTNYFQSQSHIYDTTYRQSACLSLCQAPNWGPRQDFFSVGQMRICLYGALSPTSECQSYFTTGGLPPNSCLGDNPLETHDQ
jgi:hypothetical protein